MVVGMICVHFGPLQQKHPWLFKKLKCAVVEDTASSADGFLIAAESTEWGEKSKGDAGRGWWGCCSPWKGRGRAVFLSHQWLQQQRVRVMVHRL